MGGVTESRIERRGESDGVGREVFDFFLKRPLIESDLEEEDDFVVVEDDDEDEEEDEDEDEEDEEEEEEGEEEAGETDVRKEGLKNIGRGGQRRGSGTSDETLPAM